MSLLAMSGYVQGSPIWKWVLARATMREKEIASDQLPGDPSYDGW